MTKTNMLKIIASSMMMLCVLFNVSALNYTISFTGSGASTTIENIVVQNLTQGTTVTVPANNTLNLVTTLSTSVEQTKTNENITIVQHSGTGITTISFYAQYEGVTQLSIFSVDGQKIASLSQALTQGMNDFELSLPKGVFVLQVQGVNFKYAEKIINVKEFESKPSISFVNTSNQKNSVSQKVKSETQGITQMVYKIGDCLLYKAKSGNCSTIVTDVPTISKSINFQFVSCQDADLNNYSTVTIGTQTWMVENLKTTKYRNEDLIETTSTLYKNIGTESAPKYQWAYNGNETNVAKFGRLYTWHTVVDNRNIAPAGWHIPTDTEWTILENYVSTYPGTSINVAKALAANSDWTADYTNGTIGTNLSLNNYSGFSSMPGGSRYYGGAFGGLGNSGYWWSSTESSTTSAWCTLYYYNYSSSYVNVNGSTKSYGFSVRCVKDL